MFQFKYCCVMAGLFAAASVLLYLMMDKALPGSYRESLRVLYFLEQNLPFYLSVMALLLVLFILVLTLIITLLVSHQIAGPVYRYEFVLKQMLKGEFPKNISTRQTDQLKPMVDSLNGLTNRYTKVYEGGKCLSDATDVVLHNKAENADELADLSAQINELRATLQGRNCQGASK